MRRRTMMDGGWFLRIQATGITEFDQAEVAYLCQCSSFRDHTRSSPRSLCQKYAQALTVAGKRAQATKLIRERESDHHVPTITAASWFPGQTGARVIFFNKRAQATKPIHRGRATKMSPPPQHYGSTSETLGSGICSHACSSVFSFIEYCFKCRPSPY